jgi:hypothetical protein
MLDRNLDPAAAAAHWARINAARWAAACQAEQRHRITVCDTDPFKLHYIWCLWQAAHAWPQATAGARNARTG